MPNHKHIIRWGAISIIVLVAGLVVVVFGFLLAFTTFATSGPGSAPGVGGGLLNIDSGSGNLSIGGTADNTSKLLIKSGGSTSGTFGLRVTDSSNNNLLIVRSDGVVTIASTTNVASAGIHFSDGTVQTSAYTGSVSNPVTIAGNVGAGTFGSNVGNGNFAFPASLSLTDNNRLIVGTYGGENAIYYTTPGTPMMNFETAGTVKMVIQNGGNVGIGTTGPGQKLEVAGNTSSTQFCLAGSCISNWAGAGGGQWTRSAPYVYPTTLTDSVGIGTTGPRGKFDVLSGTGSAAGNMSYFGDTGDYYHIYVAAAGAGILRTVGWANGWNISQETASKNLYVNRDAPTTSDLYLGTSGNETIVKGTGNVGIGTASPAQILSINSQSGTNSVIQFGINNTIYGYYGIAPAANGMVNGSVLGDLTIRSQSGNILFTTDGGTTANVYIKNGGNVGVGTASPGATLDIKSSVSSDNLRIGDNGSASTYFKVGRNTSTGNLDFTAAQGAYGYQFGTGAIYASSFNGAGTGLTGTAASLSVSYAATAGSAPANGGNSATVGGHTFNWTLYDNPTYLWGTNSNGTDFLVPRSTMNVGGSAGTVTAAAQPNITSVGTLTSLNVSNNSGNGTGVYGYGSSYGFYGSSNSIGVYGYGSYGTGVRGYGDTYGVSGTSNGTGVYGYGNTASSYDFYAGGPGIDYGTASSIRWKTNVQELTGSLDNIMKLQGMTFIMDQAHGGGKQVGFIGEEIGKYYPEIVSFDASSTDPSYYVTGMDYSKMTPVLLEGIKELSLRSIGIQTLDASASTTPSIFITAAGNIGIGTTAPTSRLQVVGLPVYANNAAAITGGLTAGAFYRTGGDPDPVYVVH